MIFIEKAKPNDAALIAEIGKRSFLESHGNSAPVADIEAYVKKKYTTDALAEELSNADHIYHIIYCEGRPAGYSKIILNAKHEDIVAQHVTSLDRLYLLKDFYDQKLGLQLLEYNIAISKRAGDTGIWLYTWTENRRAIAFYEKSGFKIVADTFFKISETHSNPNYVMFLDYSNPARTI